jgi:hypothetical protein
MTGSLPRRLAIALAASALIVACDDSPVAPEHSPLTDVPADLAAVKFLAVGRPTAPYTMLEIRHADGFRGYVIVNSVGAPVWFFRTLGSPGGATRRENGNFVVIDTDRGLVEVDAQGSIVRVLAQESRPGRFIHHDVITTTRNTLFFIAEDVQSPRGAPITGDAVWEWNPETGETIKRWSTFDHLDPALDWGARSRPTDWVHANSLSIGPRGNVLMSMHFLDQVISIGADYRSVEWRLGGVRATIAVDDAFSGQHTAAEIAHGRVLLFDNGFARTERYSRAAEYELSQSSARKVWEWRPARDNWARVISSARRLPNGNTLVGFGTQQDTTLGATGPIEVYEVDTFGRVQWYLTLGGKVSSNYRATPLFDF